MLLKRVACVAYCPNSVAQHAPRVLDQSDTCVDLENYNWLPKYVAKRVMGHFTARSLHSLNPSVTSQPIQNKSNLTSVTSQPINSMNYL